MLIGGIRAFALTDRNPLQNYKDAFFRSVTTPNKTLEARLLVNRDGERILEGSGRMMTDVTRRYATLIVQVDEEKFETEHSWEDGKGILKIGDNYFSVGGSHRRWGRFSSGRTRLGNIVADTTENDGNVSLKLEGGQIPELLNIAAGKMLERALESDLTQHKDVFGDAESLRKSILNNLAIKEDVKFKSVELTAEIRNGFLSSNTVKAVLYGVDDAGAIHEVELIIDSILTDVGNTMPESIDTQGKTLGSI
jgi:hypothetical protein